MKFYYLANNMIDGEIDIEKLFEIPVREKIGRARFILEEDMEDKFDSMEKELEEQIKGLASGGDTSA
jgi:V/A-type H+-transporting ATPase subunit A